MNFDETFDISSMVDFYLVSGTSKSNKKYYCICLVIDELYYPIKFINETQFNSLKGEI